MNKLQELRKKQGLSQSELAKKTNIKLRTIQDYELYTINSNRNSIDNARLDKLIPLALALNCKISDLLENEELIKQARELGI